MPRFSILQTVTVLLLFGSCLYVANLVSKYLLKEDGGYSNWSVFTECSKSCDGGIRMRRRKCNNPVPRYGGFNCSVLGPPIQVFACNRQACPINGAYGPWGEYGVCSVTCGGGVQERVRKCDSPAPQHGGKNCKEMELGADSESRACNERPCPVDGGYSIWSDFNECSKTCGGGIRTRVRTCTNPAPQNGGKDCEVLGPSEESEACNTDPCVTTPPTTEPTTSSPTTKPATAEVKPSKNDTEPTKESTKEDSEKLDSDTENKIAEDKTEKTNNAEDNAIKSESNTTTTKQSPTTAAETTKRLTEAGTASPTSATTAQKLEPMANATTSPST